MSSAAGRTRTVILRRHVSKVKKDGGTEGDDRDIAEADFEMIDGKEQDGISEWCRKYSKSFGRSSPAATQTLGSDLVPSSSAKGKGKARATEEDMEVDGEDGISNRADLSNNPIAKDEGDLDDDNYTGSGSELSDGNDSEDGDGSNGSAGDSKGEDSDDTDGEGAGKESRPEPDSEEERWIRNTIRCCDLERCRRWSARQCWVLSFGW